MSPGPFDVNVPPADWVAMNDLAMRYAEAIDTKNWELFRTAFTEDCVMTYGEPWGPLDGLDVLTDFVVYFHDPLEHLRHATSNFRVTSFSGDTATGRCSVEALLVQTGAPGGDTLRVTGVYHDDFVRTSDGWKFSSRVFASFLTEGNPDVGAWNWVHPAQRA